MIRIIMIINFFGKVFFVLFLIILFLFDLFIYIYTIKKLIILYNLELNIFKDEPIIE